MKKGLFIKMLESWVNRCLRIQVNTFSILLFTLAGGGVVCLPAPYWPAAPSRLPAACLPAELLRAGQPHQDCIRKEGRLEQDFPSFRSVLEMKICLGNRHDKFFFIFLWSCGHVNCGRRKKQGRKLEVERNKFVSTTLCLLLKHYTVYSQSGYSQMWIDFVQNREEWQIPQWDRIILVRCCS